MLFKKELLVASDTCLTDKYKLLYSELGIILTIFSKIRLQQS